MRRVLPLLAVVSLLAACGSSQPTGSPPVHHGPHGTSASASVSVSAVAAARRDVAMRQAQQLLGRIRLPAGARPSRVPRSLRVRNLGVSVLTEFAYRERAWLIRRPFGEVTSFVKAHPLPGFANDFGGERPEFFGYDLPPAHGWPMQRMYDVEFAPAHGGTYVKAEAAAAWIYPRSPQEAVPSGVREIDIRGGGVRQRVSDPAQVARIVHWFDALDIAPPGVTVGCMVEISTRLAFTFRGADGAELATAAVPSEAANGCDSISFRVGGRLLAPLIDGRDGRYAFVSRVQRLLGVCFRDPRQACH